MFNDNCIVIPAAGASTRLGRPKQLVMFEGESLIRRAVRSSLSVCENVVVVLGSDVNDIEPELAGLSTEICINKNWKDGIGSSIAEGVRLAEKKFKDLNGFLIHLSDLPLVTSLELRKLLEAADSEKEKIVFSVYEDFEGVPAYFPSRYFSGLASLEGDFGAQGLIKSAEPESKIGVRNGIRYFDVDSEEDLAELLNPKA